jgi:hypothetical protein
MFCQNVGQPGALVKQKEGNLKTLLTLAICLGIATPTFCQSASAPKDQQESINCERLVVDVHGKTIKFLQKVPVDPMTGTTDWGVKRAPGVVPEPPGGGIFDVYTKSEATALDGTKYQDW